MWTGGLDFLVTGYNNSANTTALRNPVHQTGRTSGPGGPRNVSGYKTTVAPAPPCVNPRSQPARSVQTDAPPGKEFSRKQQTNRRALATSIWSEEMAAADTGEFISNLSAPERRCKAR
ncbi:hypothetical protein GCM10017784_18990 [Deinococcus indicus]|nr:hypothetical protein GCM10017784_18990 [Deinococcus indicus]